MRWRSYVAVGDSFTEGMDDPRPDGSGYRGWADLVASRLAAARLAAVGRGVTESSDVAGRGVTESSDVAGRGVTEAVTPDENDGRFEYANLAIRGRLFHAIVDQQVPAALAMKPDLISFAGGGNDVLRRTFDPSGLASRFDAVIETLRGAGADVIIFRWANVTTRLPGRRMILPRMEILNRGVGEVADRHGAIMVDLWQDEEFHNPVLWSEDRLHMAPAGHRRVAAHVLTALRVPPDGSWLDPPGEAERRTWLAARARDARWARQHLAPWVRRRLAGRSSGDTISAKRPTLSPVAD